MIYGILGLLGLWEMVGVMDIFWTSLLFCIKALVEVKYAPILAQLNKLKKE